MAPRRFCKALSPEQGRRSAPEQSGRPEQSALIGDCAAKPTCASASPVLFKRPSCEVYAASRLVGGRSLRSGFSLIELMVVLAVVSILLGVAVPSYQSFVASTAVTTTANDLIAAINIARSEALKRDGIVSVQALDTTSNDFSDGYCVVLDSPGNCTGALRQFTVGSDEITLVISGGYSSVSFDGLGGLYGTSGAGRQFNLCRGNEDYRLIDIKLVGRPALTGRDACP